MVDWKLDLTSGAIANHNIKFCNDALDLSAFRGGTNEAEAPAKRMTIRFVGCSAKEMWIYGDKQLLTGDGRKAQLAEFFQANNIDVNNPATIEFIEINTGEFLVRKV